MASSILANTNDFQKDLFDPIDGNFSYTTNLDQSRPRSNVNEGRYFIFQNSTQPPDSI